MASKITQIRYNGEIGFKAKIRDVLSFLKILVSDEEFLNFTNEKGVKNRDIILNSYSDIAKYNLNLKQENGEDKQDASSLITADMPCPIPVTFFISVGDVTVDLIVNQSNLLFLDETVSEFSETDNSSFTVYQNKFFNEIIFKTKNNFNPTSQLLNDEIENQRSLIRENPNPQVWIWCKSLNPRGVFNENSIFDLTDFIQNINTNQTETGGNFSIQLLSIEGFLLFRGDELDGIWNPETSNYIKFNNNSNTNFFFRKFLDDLKSSRQVVIDNQNLDGYYNRVKINNVRSPEVFETQGGEITYIRTEDFFKNLISENDVIFISFDKDKQFFEHKDDFFVNHMYLKNKDWDMIGLIDSNSISINYEGNEESVSISGRDLTKLLIEDGSYFFAKSYANPENSDGIFFNVKIPNSGDSANTLNNRIDGSSKGVNRLITTGMIDMLFNPEARNINFIMNLLISRLSNIEICHDDLFKYFSDKATRFNIPFIEELEEDDDSINTTDGD